ncbi:RDD family protein [Staphylococcus sp. GDX8P114P-2]|uniref:RDD family protein n=1 Tax=Staphylococcus sp. GDX8P114P-2 TaxID=2804111 RepID=UPI001FDA8AF9|nr:RDD family protein [Staphylococcus sp. GDX8P114P-2]
MNDDSNYNRQYNEDETTARPTMNNENNDNTPKSDDLVHKQIMKVIYAGFGIRFVSFIIDLLILFGIHSLLLKPIFAFAQIDKQKLWIDYFSVAHLLDALIFYLYFVLMTKFFRQTLGKMICNIRVERDDRLALTWKDVLFREWIGRIISGTFGNLPYLVTLFTVKHKGIHDYFADTVVIRNKYAYLYYKK